MKKLWPFFLICLLVATIGWLAFSQEVELTGAVNELANQLAFANEGYIKSVSADTVYINLGQDSGIWEGMDFEVVRLGEPIVSEGVMIGHEEEIIGEIAITRVRAQMSIASITNKSKEIVEGDKVYQLTKQISRIAITEFLYGERFNNLSRDIEDRLYTAMIQRGMHVAERKRLTEILEEQAIEWTGLFDLSSAAELGKLLGVEGVIIGSITDQGETIVIRARLVDVETAQAITAAAVSVNKTPTIVNALDLGIRGKPSAIWREERAEEAPERQIIFFDNFEGEMDSAWSTNPVCGSTLGVENNALTIVGEKQEHQPLRAFVGEDLWRDYILSVDIVFDKGCSHSGCRAPWDRDHRVALFIRVHDPNNMLGFFLQPGGQSGFRVMHHGVWGEMVVTGDVPKQYAYHVVIAVEENIYSATVNDQLIATLTDSTFAEGYLGLQCAVEQGQRVYFDNFTVTPIE